MKGVTREQVISKAMMDALPTSKSMGGLIALVPGAVSPANGLDVGGSKGEQSVRISVHGARTGDMRQMVDGMLFSNLNSDGAGRLYFVNPITVQENVIDLGTAGSAQYQLGGAVINTHSARRAATGSRDGVRRGDRPQPAVEQPDRRTEAQKVTQVNGVRDIYDFSGLVGGPVVTRPAVVGGVGPSQRQHHAQREPVPRRESGRLDVHARSRVSRSTREEQTRSTQVRMTWQASKKDKITGVLRHPEAFPPAGVRRARPRRGRHRERRGDVPQRFAHPVHLEPGPSRRSCCSRAAARSA